GAFALCRVVKRHDHGLKAGDPHAESRAKRCSSSTAESGYRGYIYNVLSISEENSTVVTKVSAKSEDSTPITSPDTGREVELQPRKKGFWESQMVANASKWYLDALSYFCLLISDTETWNPVAPASLCRQASDGEDLSLWLQEDILVN
ncbi:hypothetical protein BHE74_00001682, partial [Ensete ventricosum]